SDDEWIVVIKTAADRLPTLTERIVEAHPYDVPELVAVPVIGGNPACLEWVREESREDTAPRAPSRSAHPSAAPRTCPTWRVSCPTTGTPRSCLRCPTRTDYRSRHATWHVRAWRPTASSGSRKPGTAVLVRRSHSWRRVTQDPS